MGRLMKRLALFLLLFAVVTTWTLLHTQVDPFLQKAQHENVDDRLVLPTIASSSALSRQSRSKSSGPKTGDEANLESEVSKTAPPSVVSQVIPNLDSSNTTSTSELVDGMKGKALETINIRNDSLHVRNQSNVQNHSKIDISANQSLPEYNTSSRPELEHNILKENKVKETPTRKTNFNQTHRRILPNLNEVIWAQHQMTTNNGTATSNGISSSSPFAYVFLIWLCDPDRYNYKNYIANILIASKILKRQGSQAEVVVLVMLRWDSHHTRLWPHDERLLQKHNITIGYLPKSPYDWNVYRMMFYKFMVYGLVEYEKVMFLDGDVMPLANLDYMFDFADFEETVVIAFKQEPANGGLFLTRPNATAYDQVRTIIEQQGHEKLGVHGWFDKVNGFGHVIVPPDRWETNDYPRKTWNGTLWTFYGAHVDQGLLYHFPKYVRRSMTQILARKVVNFEAGPNGTMVVTKHWKVTSKEMSPFAASTTNKHNNKHHDYRMPRNCLKFVVKRRGDRSHPGCVPPYSDFHHFTGGTKPWVQGMPVNLTSSPENRYKSSVHLWWQTLLELEEQDGANFTRMGFNLTPPMA